MRTALMLADFTDERVVRDARQLRTAYGLKRTLRYATGRDHTLHSESVSEHVFALLYLAHCFLPLEDPEGFLDVAKVHRLLLFHDFAEMVHGDVPYHLKTEEHEERERRAATLVFAALPPSLAELGHGAWYEYEMRKTPEARFVYALDKVEPIFELMDPVAELSMKRLKFSYDAHIGKKFRATEYFPIMRRFVEVLTADMLARGIFWVAEEHDAA